MIDLSNIKGNMKQLSDVVVCFIDSGLFLELAVQASEYIPGNR